MMGKIFLVLIISIFPMVSNAITLIDCKNNDAEHSITSIWPSPYLSDSGLLCFDVKGWTGFSGSNCVANAKGASWTGMVIVYEDGESQGRDSTDFRVLNPTVNEDHIEYTIEWSRGAAWRPMQRVGINRLTGEAVSYFVNEHGGESYQCAARSKAIIAHANPPDNANEECVGADCKSSKLTIFINPEVVMENGFLMVKARTNLPAQSPVMVSVVNPIMSGGDGYFGQDQADVTASGTFQAGPFSKGKMSLNPGTYQITISTPFATLQPDSVIAQIGKLGENLAGNLVEKVKVGELTNQTIVYKFSAVVNDVHLAR